MEWNAQYTILGVAGIVSVTMPLLNIKDLAVAIFHQSRVCWGWPTAIQTRVKTGPGCLQGESGALNWAFQEVIWDELTKDLVDCTETLLEGGMLSAMKLYMVINSKEVVMTTFDEDLVCRLWCCPISCHFGSEIGRALQEEQPNLSSWQSFTYCSSDKIKLPNGMDLRTYINFLSILFYNNRQLLPTLILTLWKFWQLSPTSLSSATV